MSIPATRSAIVIARAGGPEVLELRALPVPAPRHDEVRIRVRAAGVNHDCHQRRRGPTPAHSDGISISAKELRGSGSLLRPLPDVEKAGIAGALRRPVWPVRPVVHSVLSLGQASEAHRLVEAGRHVGKLVLALSQGERA